MSRYLDAFLAGCPNEHFPTSAASKKSDKAKTPATSATLADCRAAHGEFSPYSGYSGRPTPKNTDSAASDHWPLVVAPIVRDSVLALAPATPEQAADEGADRAAIAAEALLPARGTPERDWMERRHMETVAGLLMASRQRPPR